MMPNQTPAVGSAPADAASFNSSLGFLLKSFITVKYQVNQYQAWLAGINIADRYGFTEEENTLVQSAINGLDTHLDGTDMTFINRLAGPQ